MKKLLLVVALVAGIAMVKAQNIQFHYDFGKDRKYVTTTVEMFKPDKWGSTFFFLDFDYNRNKDAFNGNTSEGNNVSAAYWEIARGFKFWNAPFEMTIEYNGGTFPANAYLVGPAYIWNATDFSKGFTLKALYKTIRNPLNDNKLNFQLTGVWYYNIPLPNNMKFTFTGFADFWKENINWGTEETNYVFLTEPQLWLNVWEGLNIGSEIEIGNNFTMSGWKICPTAALKWNF